MLGYNKIIKWIVFIIFIIVFIKLGRLSWQHMVFMDPQVWMQISGDAY